MYFNVFNNFNLILQNIIEFGYDFLTSQRFSIDDTVHSDLTDQNGETIKLFKGLGI